MPVISSGRITPGTGVVTLSGNTAGLATTSTSSPSSSGSPSTGSSVSGATGSSTSSITVSGLNIGNGVGIYSATTGGIDQFILDFKTLVGGTGISLTHSAQTVTLTATGNTAVSFEDITDGPHDIVANAVVVGTSNTITWTPAAVSNNTVLTYTNEGFVWNTFSGNNNVGLIYQGTWNASTNSPTLANGTGTAGYYYQVSVAGNTILDTYTIWEVGDLAIFNGTTWDGISTVNVVTSVGISSTESTITVTNSPITNRGIINVDLTTTAVTTGSYTATNLVVDQFGRITHAANGSAVTSITIAGANGVDVANPTVTSTGTVTIGLTATGVSAGTYTLTNLTINAYGRITAATSGSTGVTSITLAGANGVDVANPTVTSTGTVTVGLTATGVSAGTYTLTNLTVDAYGRIIAATSGSGGGGSGVTSITITGANGVDVANPTVTTTGTVTVGLTATGVSAGTYTLTDLTVDAYGRISAASNGTFSISGTYGIGIVGGFPNFTVEMNDTGVTPGTYTLPTITVNAQGQITSAIASAVYIPRNYTFTVVLDGSGNIASVNSTPSGWTVGIVGSNELTVTHNLGRFPINVATLAYNGTMWVLLSPSGNPTSAFSVGITGAGLTPNEFIIYGLSATNTNGAASDNVIVSILI